VAADKLSQIAVLAAKHDLRLNVTFAGDKAADLTLAAFDAANRESSIRGKRWLLQHMQHPTPEQMAHVKALDAVVSTYTSVDFSKGAAVYVDRFDGDAWKTVVPMRQWLDAGVLVAQSTDGAHFQPLFTLWESLARVDGRTGKSLLTPEKQISREEALRMYTMSGAKILFWEDKIGSIEAGKLADLVVLDHDILSCPLDQIRDTRVLMTIGGGRIVYEVQ
jgi:predicted amidohydrolase YtcJ